MPLTIQEFFSRKLMPFYAANFLPATSGTHPMPRNLANLGLRFGEPSSPICTAYPAFAAKMPF